jgi:hypothetical protein
MEKGKHRREYRLKEYKADINFIILYEEYYGTERSQNSAKQQSVK